MSPPYGERIGRLIMNYFSIIGTGFGASLLLFAACNETSGVGGDGGEGGTAGNAPPVIDAPGTCFEVFGPNGLCFAPRAHDLGVVEVGDAREVRLGFFNFCGDTESQIVETLILEGDGLSPSTDFEITSAPTPGEPLEFEGSETIDITLSPSFAGWHRARVRYRVSHGYYDFDLVAEAVDPGESPAPFDADCLELPPTMTFSATVGGSTGMFVDASGDCDAKLGSSHIVLVSYELSGNEDGAFSVDRAEVGRALVSLSGGEPPCDTELPPLPWVAFSPPSEGAFEATLTLVTNEPGAQHEILLQGSTSPP